MMKPFQLPEVNLRRKSKGESEAHDINSPGVEQKSEKTPTKEKPKNKYIKILSLLKTKKTKKPVDTPDEPEAPENNSPVFKEKSEKTPTEQKKKIKKIKIPGILNKKKKNKPVDIPDIPVILDFNQNLAKNNLSEASQQLLAEEERLFTTRSSDAEVICTEDEDNRLRENYEALLLHLRMAVNDMFEEENQEKLKSAVEVIGQQEKQDKHWEEAADENRPRWRPLECRQIHDTMVKKLVVARLQKANKEEDGADNLSTSLKRDVCRMGKRIQKDLLHVVQNVQQCYTSDFDICNMYARLYHQAFSTKLTEYARNNIEIQDCTYILYWIHVYYPKDILKHNKLEPHINSESFEALIPEEDHKTLEEQYLSYKEVELGKWLSNALKKEEEIWQTCDKPKLIDGCYFSNLALDIIPIINGAMNETVDILGNTDNAQRILIQLDSFLLSYKKSLADLVKGKHTSLSEILKGSLVSIRQLREYIEKQENLSDETKGSLLSIVSEMRNTCHSYLLSPIHKKLKEQYKKLWTPAWFSESHPIIGDLLNLLEDLVQDFSDIQSDCSKELLNQLHCEVMTEYVRRMFKGKLKLKDKDDQEAAANFLCEDSVRINSLFIKNGSEEKWLSRILPKMSEVVRLQDPGALQLEIIMLARTYPDISECQVIALLDLKGNLSKADVRSIRKSLTENRETKDAVSTGAFFSKVCVKKKLMTVF